MITAEQEDRVREIDPDALYVEEGYRNVIGVNRRETVMWLISPNGAVYQYALTPKGNWEAGEELTR